MSPGERKRATSASAFTGQIGTESPVDDWSAGCQVVCDPLQLNYFPNIYEKGANEWGNAFTYTLLHQNDVE